MKNEYVDQVRISQMIEELLKIPFSQMTKLARNQIIEYRKVPQIKNRYEMLYVILNGLNYDISGENNNIYMSEENDLILISMYQVYFMCCIDMEMFNDVWNMYLLGSEKSKEGLISFLQMLIEIEKELQDAIISYYMFLINNNKKVKLISFSSLKNRLYMILNKYDEEIKKENSGWNQFDDIQDIYIQDINNSTIEKKQSDGIRHSSVSSEESKNKSKISVIIKLILLWGGFIFFILCFLFSN